METERISPRFKLGLNDISVESNKQYVEKVINKKFGDIKITPTEIKEQIPDNVNASAQSQNEEVKDTEIPKTIQNVEVLFPSQVEALAQRRQMLTDIIKYKEKFPHYLNWLNLDEIHTKSNPELLQIINQINFTIQEKGIDNMNLQLFSVVSNMVEAFAVNLTPLKCQGLTQHCTQNQEVVDILNELAVKYKSGPIQQLGPEYRLGIAMCGAMAQLHKINSTGQANLTNIENKPLDPNKINQYQNL